MSQEARTALFAGAAAVLLLLAVLTTPSADGTRQDVQTDVTLQAFEQEEVGAVEITAWDDGMEVFRVEMDDGTWVIPSHHNYPADVASQLAKVTTLLSGLEMGDLRSSESSDLGEFGVVHPEKLSEARTSRLQSRDTDGDGKISREEVDDWDAMASFDADQDGALSSDEAREYVEQTVQAGKLLQVMSRSGQRLGALIVGDGVPDRDGHHFVRMPGQPHVYTAEIDASALSTRFADWIETDLLKVATSKIDSIVLDRYSVNEQTRQIEPGDKSVLRYEDYDWKLEGEIPEGKELALDKLNGMRNELTSLTLVDVVPKDPKVVEIVRAAADQQLPQRTLMALTQRLTPYGYFLTYTPDGMEVVSNEGEIVVRCNDGVVYHLRVGEVKAGKADAAEDSDEEDAGDQMAEHRYIWIEADFDASLLGDKPQPPAEPAEGEEEDEAAAKAKQEAYERELEDWNKKVEEGKERVAELRRRFDEWFFVISSEAYDKIDLSRDDLFRDKTKQNDAAAGQPQPPTMPRGMPPGMPPGMPRPGAGQ